MNFICINGDFVTADQPILTADNRGFKFGDGVFETIKVFKGRMLLEQLHFDRLLFSLKVLGINHNPSFQGQLKNDISQLCEMNQCMGLGRVRVEVYRGDVDIAQYAIEAYSLPSSVNTLNKEGLKLTVYPMIRLSNDILSNIKTVNFLPYILAGKYAKEHNMDDCLLLNYENHICESSKANIFLIKKKEIYTPSLRQGCINGVMRMYIIEQLKALGMTVRQETITEEDLLSAEEVFISNSIIAIQWVQSFKKAIYTNSQTVQIFNKIVCPFYE